MRCNWNQCLQFAHWNRHWGSRTSKKRLFWKYIMPVLVYLINLTRKKRYMNKLKWIWPVIVSGDSPETISGPNCQKKNKKNYANVYGNTINDCNSQTSLSLILFWRGSLGHLYTGRWWKLNLKAKDTLTLGKHILRTRNTSCRTGQNEMECGELST